nr:MAG TPA_asm: hypothetical protein [Caudoviricetes sp.]
MLWQLVKNKKQPFSLPATQITEARGGTKWLL